MKPAPFDYVAPRTLPDALELLARHGADARVIAGGQSLVPMLALRLARPEVLVDLNRIPELVGIREDGGSIRIGALTRQAHVLASPLIGDRLPLLIDGLANVGHPPTRARGTIGGSLSHADPAAEIPAVVLAYAARMTLVGVAGERTVAAEEFTLGTFETCLEEGEILKEIVIDTPKPEGTGFVELSRRKGDFAIASAAARMQLDSEGRCLSAHLVIGGVAPTPLSFDDAVAGLEGSAVTAGAIGEAVSQIDVARFEFDNPDASLSYRRRIGPVLARRALLQAFERAQELGK